MNTNTTDNLADFDRTEKPGLFWELLSALVLYTILIPLAKIWDFCSWFWKLDTAAKGLFVYFFICAAYFIAGLILFFLP